MSEIVESSVQKKEDKQADFENSQRFYENSANVLKLKGEELKKTGNNASTNYSYGPEGPSQKKWEYTIRTDTAVFEQITLDDKGNLSVIYKVLLNNGEYARFNVENDNIINIVVNGKDGIFKQVQLNELPLEGCSISGQNLLDIVNSFQKGALATENNQNENDGMDM